MIVEPFFIEEHPFGEVVDYWIIVMEHSRYMLMLYGQIGILIVLLKMKLSLNRMAMELVNICLIKYRKFELDIPVYEEY